MTMVSVISGIKNELEVSTALVNMYAKCGCIQKAHEVFEAIPVKNAEAWTSMVVGFAIHGLAEEALNTFEKMREPQVEPNLVTLVGVWYEELMFLFSCRIPTGIMKPVFFIFDVPFLHPMLIFPQIFFYTYI